jgi:hypothetical protein
MPAKLNMFISNGNFAPPQAKPQVNVSNLATVKNVTPRPPTALTAPIISRIHNVRPGCGSCGRH